eukprot:7051706-Prymnesium_polylepis.1
MSLGYARPSALTTTVLRTPRRATFAWSALIRSLEKSLAMRVPVLPMRAARCVVLPPGEAAISRTLRTRARCARGGEGSRVRKGGGGGGRGRWRARA